MWFQHKLTVVDIELRNERYGTSGLNPIHYKAFTDVNKGSMLNLSSVTVYVWDGKCLFCKYIYTVKQVTFFF